MGARRRAGRCPSSSNAETDGPQLMCTKCKERTSHTKKSAASLCLRPWAEKWLNYRNVNKQDMYHAVHTWLGEKKGCELVGAEKEAVKDEQQADNVVAQ